jgi:protein-disulfide isomerase/uncharacterized membrane protein
MGSSGVPRIVIALFLCLAGAAVSGVLLGQHYGEAWAVSTVDAACGDSRTSGCEDVARSSWSSFAGVPVAAYGLVFYLSIFALLILALSAPPELRTLLAGVAAGILVLGLIVDLLLFGVQAFSIHAYCALCIFTYLLSAGALIALFPARRSVWGAAAAALLPEGRLAFAGWIVGTLAIAASVLGFNAMLGSRAAYRQATLLGKPAPHVEFRPAAPNASIMPAPVEPRPSEPDGTKTAKAAAPGPSAVAPSGSQDAKYWQNQARKLEATLDDPNKVEAYYTEKALREFDASTAVAIELENTPSKGFSAAPVTVVEYSDFLCVYCRQLAGAFSRFVPESNGRVNVYFKHYPLDRDCNDHLVRSTHPGACKLALGGICAHYQDKFEAYHDRVFSSELVDPQIADVVRIGGEAGLDIGSLQNCLEDPKTRAVLAAQVAEANRLGVTSTPTIYVNGKKLPRINDFIAVVDKEARKKGFKPLGQ